MRIERVVLKDHCDVALGGLERVDLAIADPDRARIERLEARDEPQERCLAAAGGAEEDEALAGVDVEVDGVCGDVRAESLRHALEPDAHRQPQYTPAT